LAVGALMSGRSAMERLYPALMEAHLGGDFAVLDESLRPRPPEMLLNLAGAAGLDQGMLVVDVGCGRGDYSALLAHRHGCRVLGLDLALGNLRLALANQREDQAPVAAYYGQGAMEALPLQDEVADLIFCNDVLLHIEELQDGLAECGRILRPGGSMIVLATVAGELLSDEEATLLFEPLGMKAQNLSREWLEAAYRQAGLTIKRAEVTGGERLEYFEESLGLYSRELMRLARMRRAPDRYRQQLGPERYESALALYTLSIYLLIGKLDDVVYWLRK
jgi:ubiquinone/menaquinone biosynthesis C-methylase UbiE